ncbi:MAG: acetyltransferase, partial [Anaerovoracaceae bacterium]
MDKSVVILGAGGHGKVIADIVLKNGDKVIGFLDDQQKEKSLLGMPILGKVSKISEFPKDIEFILAIGSNETRKFLAEKYRVKWYTGVHPSAQIGLGAIVGEGTVIMANAVINPAAIIGKHCIINTGAVV